MTGRQVTSNENRKMARKELRKRLKKEPLTESGMGRKGGWSQGIKVRSLKKLRIKEYCIEGIIKGLKVS